MRQKNNFFGPVKICFPGFTYTLLATWEVRPFWGLLPPYEDFSLLGDT
jgi:hypothetical protein